MEGPVFLKKKEEEEEDFYICNLKVDLQLLSFVSSPLSSWFVPWLATELSEAL